MDTEPLLYTTANEVDGKLELIEGAFPEDMEGTVYIVYQIGSVNSQGLPYPEFLPNGKPNHEFGSAIMSGDGMVMKIDLSREPTIKTRIMKTPCWFADYNTRLGTEASHTDLGLLKFKNFGISRMSLMLGARNPLNTAVTPARFGTDNPVLIGAYDVGRPYIVDPVSLELETALGKSNEWMTGTPAKVPWPFELFETSAHPSFDPITQELFTVNYSRTEKSVILTKRMIHHLKNSKEVFRGKLIELMEEHEKNFNPDEARKKLTDFFENLDSHLFPKTSSIREKIIGFFRSITNGLKSFFSEQKKESGSVAVHLMRFVGKGKWEKWALRDQYGKELAIKNCMHQTGLTRDYIILQDSSFKFANELLINNPFPEHLGLERFIRRVLSTTMLPYTECYIVKRNELLPGKTTATAYKLNKPLPIETIHFSCDYDNPGGEITLYGIHNAAMCVAEWVRPYDISAITKKPIDKEVLSLFALGTMDVSRVGKWKIDADNFVLKEDQTTILAEPGNISPDARSLGFNTWTVGLYTYRDIISCENPVTKIQHMWFVSGGLDPRMLTQFIEDLYKDYPNRDIPYEEVKALTKRGLPFSLNYLNTDTMKSSPQGYYQFKENDYLRSIQFVPRTTPTPGLAPGLDGYIYCSVQAAHQAADGSLHRRGEFWIFDAAAVAEGPICKQYHPEVEFCFTLHSAWMADPQPNTMQYKVDVREDYNEVIDGLPDKKIIQPFFEKYVYPYCN